MDKREKVTLWGREWWKLGENLYEPVEIKNNWEEGMIYKIDEHNCFIPVNVVTGNYGKWGEMREDYLNMYFPRVLREMEKDVGKKVEYFQMIDEEAQQLYEDTLDSLTTNKSIPEWLENFEMWKLQAKEIVRETLIYVPPVEATEEEIKAVGLYD